MINIILNIVILVLLLCITYCLYHSYKYNNHLRLAKEGDVVKFYINGIKQTGKINIRNFDNVQIKYTDNEDGIEKYHYCNITDTYPI